MRLAGVAWSLTLLVVVFFVVDDEAAVADVGGDETEDGDNTDSVDGSEGDVDLRFEADRRTIAVSCAAMPGEEYKAVSDGATKLEILSRVRLVPLDDTI